MPNPPFFSVVIPVFNRKHRIGKAIESMLAQTFQDWELLLVDDASTDSSFEFMNSFKDPRIKVFKNSKNMERCRSRNEGILKAQGQYIAFLDSDDYHLPEHYQILHDAIKEQGFPKAFFFTNAWNESEEGLRSERECPDFNLFSPEAYFLRHTVNPQRWAVAKEVMQKHLFDPEITIAEDMETSLRMHFAGVPAYQIKARSTVYVAASDSFTHGASNKWERELNSLKRIFAKHSFRGKLPKKETNRLLSMCHFHLAMKAFVNQQPLKVWRHALPSFFLCPKGYNGKTNKPLLVACTYSLPLLGWVIKKYKNKR